MTREDILAMPAGKELDALVAEKVMGWARKVATDGATEFWDNGTFCGGKWVEPVSGGPWKLDDYSNTWNPSESISAAWEVVEKIGSRKEWMLYRLGHTDEDGNLKYKCIFLQVFSGVSAVAKSLTAPEAVCKAALQAVLEESQ